MLKLDEKMLRLKNNICIIEIESSSFCNRKCKYCINYSIDKISSNFYLEDSEFKKVIKQLALIDYDRTVTFHRFNEPFFDKNDMILKRISYTKKLLKNASLVASTNGDYLDQDYLNKIANSGLDELYIQCHYNDYTMKNVDDLKNDITQLNNSIGSFKGKFIKKGAAIVFVTVNSPFKVLTIEAKNFVKDGFDRGGLVNTVESEIISGQCYGPLTTLTIDYNGSVNICCNTVSYDSKHAPYIIGNIKDNTIYEIYNSPKAIKQQMNLRNGIRTEICYRCKCNYNNFLNKYNIEIDSLQ